MFAELPPPWTEALLMVNAPSLGTLWKPPAGTHSFVLLTQNMAAMFPFSYSSSACPMALCALKTPLLVILGLIPRITASISATSQAV